MAVAPTGMARARLRGPALIGAALVVLGGTTVLAGGEMTPGSCPGYVAHLRTARAYLARGDRKAAAQELRKAESALDSCATTDAKNGVVASAAQTPNG